MKLSVPLLLSSLLLLSASAARAADTDAVHDTDGNELKRGNEYYILQSPGIGGDLTLAASNGTCPLYVAKANSEVDMGLPVRFYPVDQDEDTVRLLRDTNFEFSASTLCVQSTVWQLGSHPEGDGGRLYVTTGGVVGNPGIETLSNWFRIEKLEDGSNNYKLGFCPGVCDFCRPFCGDLGLFVEDGTAWLGIRGSPLSVAFKKV